MRRERTLGKRWRERWLYIHLGKMIPKQTVRDDLTFKVILRTFVIKLPNLDTLQLKSFLRDLYENNFYRV